MKERNLKLDNAKGILITLVVIGHMLLPIQGTTRGVTNFFYMIYAFHMPAFVFISGLLAQRIYCLTPSFFNIEMPSSCSAISITFSRARQRIRSSDRLFSSADIRS